MPISLPETIDRHLFRTIDGRLTTEAETALAAAQGIVCAGRTIDDPDLLTRAVLVLMMYGGYVKWPQPVIFPAIGILQACFDRKLYRGNLSRWLSGIMPRMLHASLESEALRKYGENSTGWNDYHMAYWFMTADSSTAQELHRRATLDPNNPRFHRPETALAPPTVAELQSIKAAAVWMVQGVRRQYPDFDEAIRKLETRFKRPVAPEDPGQGPPAGAAA